MAFGNGGSHSKRGWMRPSPGSRLPVFLIIALVAGCSFLVYNVYTTALDRNSLVEQMSLVNKKLYSVQHDKTELQLQFEAAKKSLRTLKQEAEGLRSVEQNSLETRKELTQCREHVTTMQGENADLKEAHKTELETLQRKMKEAEDKWESLAQEKSRLESELQKLRGQAQEAARRPAMVEEAQKQQGKGAPQAWETAADGGIAPPEAPHRGAPDGVEKPLVVGKNEGLSHDKVGKGEGNAPLGNNAPLHGQEFHATSLSPPVFGGGAVAPNESSSNKLPGDKQSQPGTATTVENLHKDHDIRPQQGHLPQALSANASDDNVHNQGVDVPSLDDHKGPKAVPDHGISVNSTDNNGTVIQDSAEERRQILYEGAAATERRNKKDRERQLNKVIEESAPVEERRRMQVHERDRSRGEQDDTAPENDNGSEALKGSKHRTHVDRPAEPMDNSNNAGVKAVFKERNPSNDYRYIAREIEPSQIRINGGENGSNNKDQLMTVFPSIEGQEKPVAVLPQPDKAPVPPHASKDVNRKGLKDDYHYKDEEEEGEAGHKNKGRREKNERYDPGSDRMEPEAGNSKVKAAKLDHDQPDIDHQLIKPALGDAGDR